MKLPELIKNLNRNLNEVAKAFNLFILEDFASKTLYIL